MTTTARPLPPWLAVKALFERLVDLPPAQRPMALALSGVAPELAAEVRELLAQHEAEEREGGAFLAQPALLQVEAESVDRRGERLGPWRLGTRLGAGGMGEVWEARRDDGAYEARVAVKVLKAGADSALLLEHFAQEQRLLARLNHPNIARLLDAGRTEDGRPFFVLEAVDGQPIDAAARGLPLPERLRLFLQLADAVAHAHRQQLIHRDLKPANVLVTVEGQVKLLDFGIAQALDLAPATGGPRPLTPGWASPEQQRGEAVTAATDIYSLGVLLHLLATGQRPDDAPAAAEALRALGGDLPAILARALAEPVAARYPSCDALAADLRAALAGQPVSARPHTPLYLAGRFVRRHRAAVTASALALLALVAGLGATAWQAREAAALLALAALALGLGVSTWQYRRAAAARDDARERLAQTSTLVRDILMRYADTVTYLPGGLRMKADLLKDTIAYLDKLATSAPQDAELAGERAKALVRLADMQLPGRDATLDEPEEAQRNADAALALFPAGEPAHRDDPVFYMWWVRALLVRQTGQRLAGNPQAALLTAERQRGFLQTVLQRFPASVELRAEYASTLIGIGQAYDSWVNADLARPEAALEAFAAAEAVYVQLRQEQPGNGDNVYQLGTLAGAQMITLFKLGRFEEALAHGRRGVALRDECLALQPDNVAYRDGAAGERNNLTRVLLERASPADVAEALAVSARGEEIIQALQAQDPSLPTWVARRQLFALHRGRALLAAGQPAAALPRLRDALAGAAGPTSGAALRRRGWCGVVLAQAHQALGQAGEAGAAAEAAAADLQAFLQTQPADPEALALQAQAQALRAAP